MNKELDKFSEFKNSLIVTSTIKDGRWRAPKNPTAQAWLLRELFRQGKNQFVLSCERTQQIDPKQPQSPVITCQPNNCQMPCFNCTVAVLIGRKEWEWIE